MRRTSRNRQIIQIIPATSLYRKKTLFKNVVFLSLFLCFSISTIKTDAGTENLLLIQQDTIVIGTRVITQDDDNCVQIYFFRAENRADTQMITDDCDPITGNIDKYVLFLRDLTFDGIPELCFENPNTRYDIWQWDTLVSEFKLIGELPDFDVDYKNKTISGSLKNRFFMADYFTYSWENDSFKLLRSVVYSSDPFNKKHGNSDDSPLFKVNTVYGMSDCTMIFSQFVYDIYEDGKESEKPYAIIDQGYCKEADCFIRLAKIPEEEKEVIVLVDNTGKIHRNLSDEFYKADSILNCSFAKIKHSMAEGKRGVFVKMEREWIKKKNEEEKQILSDEGDPLTAQYHRYLFLINETINREKQLWEIVKTISE